jgi:hypothetical protein
VTKLQQAVLDALRDQTVPVTVEELRLIVARRGYPMAAAGMNRMMVRFAAQGLAVSEKIWRPNPARPKSLREINAWKSVQA